MNKNLLTVKDVAEQLCVHPTTVHRMIGRGELDAYRVGGSVRIEPGAVEAYLQANRIVQPTPRATLRRQPSPAAQAYPWLTNAS